MPNNAFKGSGTKIMTDVIFLQKRDTLRQQDEPWLHLAEDANGITMNHYFVEHPEMICGKMEIVAGPYGPTSTCQPIDPDAVDRFGKPLLETQIDTAMQHLTATLTRAEIPVQEESGEDTKYIDADPFVRNFSYTVKDDKIYYREGAVMRECNPNAASAERIRKLVELRDTTRALIDAQLQDLSDEEIHRLQAQLNRQYDAFRAKHGLINSRSAELSFRDDSSYYLLCSLENVDEKGNFISKSDMFTKRTIRSAQIPDHADTASDALALSIGERAKVDMPYMMHLTGKDEATLAKELAGVIFVEPFRKQEDSSPVYLMADEYLSGNVREKLRVAHVAADQDPAFRINVEALEQVQPKDLTAGEITVRLGVTWIGSEIIKQFADELFQSTYREQKIAVRYNEYLNNWYISNKSLGNDNIRVTNTYGTKRINGYHLLENALNLRATKIYDTIYDENGKEQHKLNGPATEEAQAKQRMIEDAFKDWIFKDRERRESLVALYNEKFNCIRPREYDGSHIQFFGMNPEIALRPHQRNAIAHILYGHNTLLAHVVGAGKTYEMVAAAMEKKRLGLCSKTLVAVPNHLTGQFASEALKLYPNANILVTTQRDFEKSNRKRFCAKIATGNYDIVVIGHSQFEKIPLSDARKAEFIRKQIDELEMQLESMDNSDSRLTVKQLESKKKQLKTKLSNLLDAPKRDDVVTFEELGADSLMVDEAHNFKNLMTVTKMHNIAGISTTESQKASDLFMKCQYLDEITGARGVNKTEKFADDDLRRLLSYTQNQDKTEHQLYVTGFHCDPETACMSMELTKRLWEQPADKGVLAYHIIQSFSPGEATPDQVHEIGCEFARRFLADRFECTVSTHLDKGHLHNHIVVNSVSYADGKMFRNNFDTYYHGIRQVSDELCRENRLSVIETDGKGKSYDEWLSGQTGKPTIRGMVRKDVEQAMHWSCCSLLYRYAKTQ